MWKRAQLGDMFTIGFQAPDTSSISVADWSEMRIYDSNGVLTSTTEFIAFPARLEGNNFGGFFTYLGPPLSVGLYMVFLQATMTDGTVRKEAHQLEILPGGNLVGNIIATHYNGLPEANGVYQQLDGGILERKSNPR